ncbi:MAG TPA: energy-coupling factor transporter transmembrane component T [Gemmatimonadaceae bacterium]
MSDALARWNPLTPLVAALVLVVLAYAGPAPVSAPLALVVALALAWRTGVGARVTWLALIVGVPTFALLWLMNGVIAPDGARVGGALPLAAAARDANAIALPLTAAIAALGWTVVGIAPRRLTRALAARGLPAWSAYVLVASLEAVPEARRRAHEVLDAQRCRGVAVRGGVLGRLRSLLPMAGPLIVSLVTESEERALALDARGFEPRRHRTAMVPIEDPGTERAIRAALWIVLAGILAWRFIH